MELSDTLYLTESLSFNFLRFSGLNCILPFSSLITLSFSSLVIKSENKSFGTTVLCFVFVKSTFFSCSGVAPPLKFILKLSGLFPVATDAIFV